MSEHPIDKIFQQGLGQHQAPVPASLWDNIAADQARKLRRSRWIKGGSAALATMLLVSLAIFFWPAAETGVEPLATPAITAQELGQETAANSTDQAMESDFNVANSTIGAATISSPLKQSQNTSSESANTTNPEQRNNENSDFSRNTQYAQREHNNELQNASTQTAKTLGSSEISSTETSQLQRNNENHSIAESDSQRDTKKTNLVSGNEAHSAQTVAAAAQAQAIESSVAVPALLPTLPLPRLAPYERSLPQVSIAEEGIVRRKKHHFEMDLLGGFAYAHQLLHTKEEAGRSALNAREISEFPEVSYLAGMRFSYRLHNRFSLRSGLSFAQIRNQFEYDQQVNAGTDSVQTFLIKSSNRIRLLEVPLLLGYELPGKRFRLALNAGPVINLSTKASGRYLLPNSQQPVMLEEDNIYHKNVGISWQGSLTAAYDLGGGNSLLVEPTLKSFPRSFTKDSYALKEQYWMVGLQVGLRHRLQ